ncbi:lactoylglutathione lyase [Polymorphobacter glacialis]|uniref:Lactoylglutathione lyase n=1 Tax=Sandarakinorhabdus glacialis TaxID=1614636 RepID=A0A917EBQ0_9SPHN|nr:methylmalonyl-CoA epimerase [Polymorphobacter glacialis]GGE20456.1 lactoylglutathione lyase [Polymorphobacter glacialis]
MTVSELPPLLLGRLNHVGIACVSIDATVAMYARLFGATVSVPAFDLPAQGVRVAFIDVANSQLELIEPLGADSPIHGFLKKNPAGGQHHVCFEVKDIIAARDAMRARGATVLGTGEPRIGAHGVPVIFVHPRDAGGVLIELMEEPEGQH